MSKGARQQSARERMREQRRRQELRERRMRRLLIGGAVVVVIAIAVGIGVFVQTQRASGGGDFAGDLPPGKLSNGAVTFAAEGVNKPVVDVWEDFQCPVCQKFEKKSGDTLKQLAANGEAKVVYHPVKIIDERSLRSGSAALCAADKGKYMAYHDVLYENQPPERPVQGFTNSDLRKYGDKVGLGSSFDKCVKQGGHKQDILKNTQQASQKPTFRGTPTIYLDGKRVGDKKYNPDALKQVILSAGKK